MFVYTLSDIIGFGILALVIAFFVIAGIAVLIRSAWAAVRERFGW